MSKNESFRNHTLDIDDKRRLLFFSLEDWDHVWRRNQFICADLLRRFRNLEILWVSPPYDLSHEPTRFDPRALKISRDPETPGLMVFKPLKLLPNVLGRKINNFFMQRQLESVLRQAGWSVFDLWINDQKARNYLPRGTVRKSVYDVTDDWTQFDQPPRVKQAVIADDAYLLDTVDETIVCSEWLYRKNAIGNRKVHLIANGVDANRYSPDALSPLRKPEEFKNLSKIAGYVGTLHSERLDLDLIEEIARIAPDVNFAFIGPNCLTDEQTEKLKRHKNIILSGPIDYKLLPSYMKCIDVFMTPHKVSPFTESLDPLKLYEYMSTGKPIVSTPCSGFRDLPELVFVEADAAQFAHAICTAIESEDTKGEQRIKWAANQTWQNRVDDVVSVLSW